MAMPRDAFAESSVLCYGLVTYTELAVLHTLLAMFLLLLLRAAPSVAVVAGAGAAVRGKAGPGFKVFRVLGTAAGSGGCACHVE
jgi:hypothetical protein